MSITLSRAGAINNTVGTWAQDNALFLKVSSGETITAFQRACVFRDKTMVKTIQSGKSAQFPVFGRATAAYHTPGNLIDGQGNMAQNEVTIKIDDYLIAAATIYSLDEAKAHYDARQIYTTELGQALARAYDKRTTRMLVLAARVSASDLTANLPAGLTPDQQSRVGTRVDLNNASPTPDDYVAAVFAAAEAMDKKDVPRDGRYLAVTPEAFYTLIQSTRAVNQDFNGSSNGSYASGEIARLAGFTIFPSNHIEQGNVTAAAGEQGFTYAGADVVLSSVDMTDTRMIAFRSDAVGVVKLRDLSMKMTGNDYETMYESTLMTAKYACGWGYLRPESVVEIYNSL